MSPATLVIFAQIFVILAVFVHFERTHPSAAELVMLAELSAAAAFARAIFSFVPYFTPVFGIIAVSALALGAERGFVIGALGALGSNFIFGQGAWTVFQMVSFGSVGAFFGLIGNSRLISRQLARRSDFVVCAAASVLVIMLFAGPLMDLSGFFLAGVTEKNYLRTILLGGIIFNAAHAASTVITICFIARPMLFHIDRIIAKTNAE